VGVCRAVERRAPSLDPLPAGEGRTAQTARREPASRLYRRNAPSLRPPRIPHPGNRLTEITGDVASWVGTTGIATGLLTLHCLHTSASLLITENASGAVQRDVVRWLEKLAREDADYEHDDEGPDDMPPSQGRADRRHPLAPGRGGKPVLGTWQGIFLAEHRRARIAGDRAACDRRMRGRFLAPSV